MATRRSGTHGGSANSRVCQEHYYGRVWAPLSRNEFHQILTVTKSERSQCVILVLFNEYSFLQLVFLGVSVFVQNYRSRSDMKKRLRVLPGAGPRPSQVLHHGPRRSLELLRHARELGGHGGHVTQLALTTTRGRQNLNNPRGG